MSHGATMSRLINHISPQMLKLLLILNTKA